MSAMHLPRPKEVRDLLAGLLGRDVEVAPGAPVVPTAQRPATLASCVDASLTVRALVLHDLPLSAWCGAGLALLPPPVAAEAVEAGVLSESLAENLHEVLNVSAALFNVGASPHVRLHLVHPAGHPLPADLRARALALGAREDLVVTVAGYGEGRLSVVLV